MKLIIPMAGMGKRMRPHTLTIPKPLISIAGKPIVQRLVEDIVTVIDKNIEEIAFVIGDFGKDVEENLISIANSVGAKGKIYYQKHALGTAHAVYCAAESISGDVVVAFADTLFSTNDKMDTSNDGSIWVHSVKDPSSFGVVLTDKDGIVQNFIEKPKDFISDLAIVGVYYFKSGENLLAEIKKLIDNNEVKNGEFQLTDALQNMMSKGTKFSIYRVPEWLDCGNKNATVYTNRRVLDNSDYKNLIHKSVINENSIIIEPCFIDKNVKLVNSIVGPHVSIGESSMVSHCVIANSIIQSHSKITYANFENSILGNYVEYTNTNKELNIGDFTVISQ